MGNLGDCTSIGEGIYELRFFFGSGYRIYFGMKNEHVIVILGGEDKGSQTKDIEYAKTCWKEYQEDIS